MLHRKRGIFCEIIICIIRHHAVLITNLPALNRLNVGVEIGSISFNGSGFMNDISQCKAKMFGSTDVVICLVKHVGCGFLLSYDGQDICIHPKKKEIVLRTEQVKKK